MRKRVKRKIIFICSLLTCTFLIFCIPAFSQKPNWQNLDLKKDSLFGISTGKAYAELLKNKKSRLVIVGIIDSGVDTAQEDLKAVLWTDPETGIHGWNYIGAETGREDVTLLVGYKKDFYDSLSYTMVPETFRSGYQAYRRLTPQLESKIEAMKNLIAELETIQRSIDTVLQKIGKANPGINDFKSYQPENDWQKELLRRVTKRLLLYPDWAGYHYNEITSILEKARYHVTHGLNLENQEADTARGDENIFPDQLGPVKEPNMTAYHGTHVAGIIGAVRNNDIGMNGIADHVQILMLKDNGTIREMRDDALARAIRFAVDHGAKIINLSFGKPYSWDKKKVDEAVKYAMQKDVLIIHAAGNAGENLDNEDHFPNPVYADKSGIANAWIEVGASGWKDDSTLAAPFSNYGKKDVDVFAPGRAIYSTIPFNQYVSWDGTSMATPVVSGLAALIREYYPQLTAAEVKKIIVESVVKRPVLADKCASGGVVNAYNALKLASTYK
jgi:subtilisin family serine protease